MKFIDIILESRDLENVEQRKERAIKRAKQLFIAFRKGEFKYNFSISNNVNDRPKTYTLKYYIANTPKFKYDEHFNFVEMRLGWSPDSYAPVDLEIMDENGVTHKVHDDVYTDQFSLFYGSFKKIMRKFNIDVIRF